MNLPYANRGIRITGVGAALPDKVLTNADLTHHMQTTDSWIRERTGIGQRHIGGTTAGLATDAARQAMERAGVHGDDIDLVILATTSPDHTCPGTSPAVAAALGLDCGAFDLQAACSGWVYGLIAARGFVAQGMNRILVIGSETLDRITDYTDRGTGILFGNGAGAAVVEALPDADDLLGWDIGADGRYVSILYAEPGDVLKMDGKEVFRQAVTAMQRSTTNTLAMAGLQVSDIDVVIPHQANVRIVEAAWKRIGFTMEQTVMILENTGNTSAASIPLALDHALATERIHPGQLVLFLGFGAGMTWASALVRWPG
jgi:3-oxoacyl-[acyl-carrier-protein] synthase III